MTDDFASYRGMKYEVPAHPLIHHGQGKYLRGRVHTDSAEGWFSQLKQSLDGTHRHVTTKHFHRCVNEFDLRHNTRKLSVGERTARALRRSAEKPLMSERIKGVDK